MPIRIYVCTILFNTCLDIRRVFAVNRHVRMYRYMSRSRALLFVLAPEILRGDALSSASDMWQLGLLMFFW
jgi:hypothetical protein